MGGGLTEDLFTNAEEGTIFNLLFRKFFDGSQEEHFHRNIREMVDTLVDGDYLAVYGVFEGLSTFKEYECAISAAWVSDYPNHLAMAVHKESVYAEFFKAKIMRYFEQGAFR